MSLRLIDEHENRRWLARIVIAASSRGRSPYPEGVFIPAAGVREVRVLPTLLCSVAQATSLIAGCQNERSTESVPALCMPGTCGTRAWYGQSKFPGARFIAPPGSPPPWRLPAIPWRFPLISIGFSPARKNSLLICLLWPPQIRPIFALICWMSCSIAESFCSR